MENKRLEQEKMDEETLRGAFEDLLQRGDDVPSSHAEVALSESALRLWEHSRVGRAPGFCRGEPHGARRPAAPPETLARRDAVP